MTSTDKARGRFSDLPGKLRRVEEIVGCSPTISEGQLVYIGDVAGDAARQIEALAAENVALRAEVQRLNREADGLRHIAKSERLVLKALKEKAEAERDQALARLAAVQRETLNRAAVAVDFAPDTGDRWGFKAAIRALPLDPDAEAALKRVVDAAWNEAVEASARAQEAAYRKGVFGEKHPDHIRALARPTEGDQDV